MLQSRASFLATGLDSEDWLFIRRSLDIEFPCQDNESRAIVISLMDSMEERDRPFDE